MNINWDYVERKPNSEITPVIASLTSFMLNAVRRKLTSSELTLVANGLAPIEEFLDVEDTMVTALEAATDYPDSGDLLDDPLRARLAKQAWSLATTVIGACRDGQKEAEA